MVFKLGDVDYSDKVVMDSYDVNQIDVYTSWEDANGTVHRSSYRKKIEGQFDMKFSNVEDYQQFIINLRLFKVPNMNDSVRCRVAVNNLDEVQQSYFYIDYATIRTMNNNYTKGYLSFTVTIEER